MSGTRATVGAALATLLVLSGCGSDDDTSSSGGPEDQAATTQQPTDVPDEPGATGQTGAGSPTAAPTDEPTGAPTVEQPTNGVDGGTTPTPRETVTDDVSGVAAVLPESVEPEEQQLELAQGDPITLRSYASSDGTVEVGLNVLDVAGAEFDLDQGLTGTVQTLQGDLVDKTATEVEGYPARAGEITIGENTTVFVQLIALDDHVIQPLVAGPAEAREATQAAFDALLDSLVLS